MREISLHVEDAESPER